MRWNHPGIYNRNVLFIISQEVINCDIVTYRKPIL